MNASLHSYEFFRTQNPLQCCFSLSFTIIFMVTALLNLQTACLPPSGGLAAPDFLLTLTHFLSYSLMQVLTSIFISSSLLLVNSGTLFLNLYFHLPTSYTPSTVKCQGTPYPKLATLWKFSS